jgi:Family of unknown function (DUF6677)
MSQTEKSKMPPVQQWGVPLALAWLLPGGGHFYLRKWNRAVLLLFAIAGMFVFGLLMRGRMFEPASGDLFTTVVNWGGYIGDLATGALYFLASWLGYDQPQLASAVADYGTKFLVCAGLLNILAMIDAYEIAIGEKP